MFVEQVNHKGKMLAVILRAGYHKDGIAFFTPCDFSQQLGYMNHKAGDIIPEHIHVLHPRNITDTQETLFIRNGKVKVNLYSPDRTFLISKELSGGDVILLVSGGHGFEFLEPTEIIEVKQGPYCGDQDKVRFRGIEK
jgi:hypothetical protein